MIEIKWTDTDPTTGERRFLCADKFARVWRFRWKSQRRGYWNALPEPTRAIWEIVLDGLQRRYQRREGVSEADVQEVEHLLKHWKEPPSLD